MEKDALNTPEQVVAALYRQVSVEAGGVPDWNDVRALFIDEAIVVALEGPVRDTTLVMPLDDFIDFLVRFIESDLVQEHGFDERIIRMKPVIFGEMAHILVLYETRFPGSTNPPGQGIDSVQLVRRGGCWQIVSITNELPGPETPLPDVLRLHQG